MSTNTLDETPPDQPRDVATGRYICTQGYPMPINSGRNRWLHPDAKDDGRNDPYYDHYKCPNCGTHFAVEVAE